MPNCVTYSLYDEFGNTKRRCIISEELWQKTLERINASEKVPYIQREPIEEEES